MAHIDSDALESDSGSDGGTGESDAEIVIANTLQDDEMHRTSVRKLLTKTIRSIERKFQETMYTYSRDRYAEMERRQAENTGCAAIERVRRRQHKHPRVQPQLYIAFASPEGRVRTTKSSGLVGDPFLERASNLVECAMDHVIKKQQLEHMLSAESTL